MVANALSLLRVALVPGIVYTLRYPGESRIWWTLGLLATAALTDLADGYVARRFNQVSRAGQILDPIADKIFLVSLGVALVLWHGFPGWLVAAIVVRDLGIVIAGAFLYGRRDAVIPPNRIGKNTTAILVLTAVSFVLPAPGVLREALVWTSAFFLLLSSASYVALLRKTLGRKTLGMPEAAAGKTGQLP